MNLGKIAKWTTRLTEGDIIKKAAVPGDCEKFGLGPLQKAQLLSEYFVNSVEQEFLSTKGELTASVSGPGVSASASASESDVSYGAGANFALSDKIRMNA